MKNPKRPVEENPFYGKRAMLDLYKNGSKVTNESSLHALLNAAKAEAKTAEDKALLNIIIFNIGDIGGRKPNYLRNDAPGGEGARMPFIWAMKWVMQNITTFPLDLVPQHTNFENLFYNQIRTTRKGGRLVSVNHVLTNPIQINRAAEVIEALIKAPKAPHTLIAKFLTVPKYSSRKSDKTGKRRVLKPHTVERVRRDQLFIEALSQKMGWLIENKGKYVKYTGLVEYKKAHLEQTEAHLFSSKKILEFGKVQFLNWLDQLPAGARYRVEKRLERYAEKWGNLPTWYGEWVNSKEEAQKQLREFKSQATESMSLAEQQKLKELTKAAKVTTGGTSFIDLFEAIGKATEQNSLKLALEALLEKVVMQVPVLPIVDVSGSMVLRRAVTGFSSAHLAALMATIFLTKNPSDLGSDFLMHFSTTGGVIDSRSPEKQANNRFMVGTSVPSEKLVDKADSLLNNYQRVYNKLNALNHGGTNISAISECFANFVDHEDRQARIELIQQYPVLLILSDGDLNNHKSPQESLRAFQHELLVKYGWNGLIVMWDACVDVRQATTFENMENVMYFGGVNPSILTQICSKIHDLEVVDVYTPLKSLFLNERYEAIKARSLKVVPA